jgi:predicted DNA-binding protein
MPDDSSVGRPKSTEGWVRFATKLPAEIKDKLDAYQQEVGLPLNDILSRAIELYTAEVRDVRPWPRPISRPKPSPKKRKGARAKTGAR